MSEPNVTQLTTLWFVVLVFIKTDLGNAEGGLITAIEILSILLVYALPVMILVRVGATFSEE